MKPPMEQPLFIFAQEVILGAWKPDELAEQAHRAMSAHRRMLDGQCKPTALSEETVRLAGVALREMPKHAVTDWQSCARRVCLDVLDQSKKATA